MNRADFHILVLGAGIAGLLAARSLANAGFRVTVAEKSRGCGGRMATRRMGGGRLDHGAQFFTVRDPAFARWVEAWRQDGHIREWFRHLPGESTGAGHPRYIGVDGMNRVGKALAGGLDVRTGFRAAAAERHSGRWRLVPDDGEPLDGDFLLLTAPVPQSLALLGRGGAPLPSAEADRLGAVRYECCLAGLATLDAPSRLPEPGGMKVHDGGPAVWVADNGAKGISAVPAVTIHSSHPFALEHWDRPDTERFPLLFQAVEDLIGARVVESAVHRWAFNQPVNPLECGSLVCNDLRLGFAGDGLGGPRVEGAAVSGLHVAGKILTRFGEGQA